MAEVANSTLWKFENACENLALAMKYQIGKSGTVRLIKEYSMQGIGQKGRW